MEQIRIFVHEWNIYTIILRLILSFISGGSVGILRSIKRRGAGFKTHVLVCMGSCLISLTGVYMYYFFNQSGDITRLPGQVVAGVGFLGVGTIMVTGNRHIRGLTTASGLWACAGIGIAFGVGFYSAPIATTLIIVLVYTVFEDIDDRIYSKSRLLDLYIEFDDKKSAGYFIRVLRQKNFRIVRMEMHRNGQKESGASAVVEIESPSRRPHDKVINDLLMIKGVEYIEEE